MPFPYFAEVHLNDGTSKVLDLEEHGWADKDMLARTVRFSLVPKEEARTARNERYPFLVVNIPPGAKPVYRSRVIRKEGKFEFRVFCLGWKKGRQFVWTWVLPTGDVETGTGDDSYLADILYQHLVDSDAPKSMG